MRKQYYNKLIVEKEKCTVFLYGDIGDSSGTVSSDEIVTELLEACKENKPVEIRINSNGGEVYAGIAIFNALRNCDGNVCIYVDGVAASIASVIALCGKPLQMSRYARLMLHRVSGTCNGTIDDMQMCIDEMENLEETLCQIYSIRCRKTAEEIKTTYFDGKDHWITAQQALELGLIDGIYDTDVIPDSGVPEEIYNTFNNRFRNEDETDDFVAFRTALCRLLGISSDSTEEGVYKAVKRLIRCRSTQDNKDEIDNAIKRGWFENAQRSMFVALARSNRQAFTKFLEERGRKDALQVEELLDEAVRTGRVLPMERNTYKNIGESMGANVLANLISIKPSTMRAARYINIDKEDRRKWTLNDWRTYAPRELASNPKLYEELRKKESKTASSMSLDWYRRNNPEYLKDHPEFYTQLIEQEYKNQ